jgi:hypothetical protein
VAVAAVVAVVVGAIALVTSNDDGTTSAADRPPAGADRDPATTTTEGPPSSTTATTVPDDIETVVHDIARFVEQERGLPFLRDVPVDLADEGEFQDRLLADFDDDADDLVTQGRVLEALGLVEPGTDLVAATRQMLGVGVVGFYDPETDELVVRGAEVTPLVRSVIAHELTHALDDQHFELDRPALDDADDESGYGFTALVEGNAQRVEQAYRDTFTAAEEAQAAQEEATLGDSGDLAGVPLVLLDLLVSSYVLGPELVAALLDDGGQARLDAAFVDPPATSEQILYPATYLAGEGAVDVPVPAADGDVIDQGVLGAAGLAELLGDFLSAGPVGDDAVEGWGGDRYVAWDAGGGRTCVAVNLIGDREIDTAEILDALGDWADAGPFGVDATVAQDPAGFVTLRSCSG